MSKKIVINSPIVDNSSQNLIALQHKLLMSIVANFSPIELISAFSHTAINALNLENIHYFMIKNDHIEMKKQSFSIPNNGPILKFPELLEYNAKPLPSTNTFVEELNHDGCFYYVFSIKNFGYIIFESSKHAFEKDLIEALWAPIYRFGKAYINIKHYELSNQQRNKIKEITTALKLENQKFDSILSGIKDGVIAININKRIFFANHSAYSYIGLDQSHDFDKQYYKYFRLLSIDTKEDITKKLEMLAIENTIWTEEEPVIFKTANGQTSICELNVQKIQSQKQNPQDSHFYFVITFHDISETYKMEQALAWQASHDHLTQCLNRSGFEEQFEQIVLQNDSHNHALIYMDLDRFKYINDIGGHLAGDALLKQIAALMNQEIGEEDLLARVGGDEFCIITHSTSRKYPLKLAEKIRKQVDQFRFQWEDNVFSVGISLGLVNITPADKDADELFFRADDACIFSKNNGRNLVTVAKDSDPENSKKATSNRINYINLINQSLSPHDDDYSFVLYQQRIKAISDDQKDHIEVLLRMEHDNKIIMPNDFLPTAERFGKIASIDLWVVKNSLSYIKHDKNTDVNVNLSGITLSDECARQQLHELISTHPEEAQSLCLEITETAAITNLSNCIEFMDKLSQYGVSFALDDFGTGVSSFSYLKSLPVKYLKIDGSFIRDICNNEIDQIVVRSITDAAKAMSIQTVAEYVEDAEILDMITHIGVDYAQGYHLTKPEKLRV